MAYALGPIGPDERHERIFVRRRPRRLLVILVALAAMLGASGGVLTLYRWMTHPAAPADVPLIRADAQPMQHRPANPGGITIPGQGTMVLDGGQDESKVEELLPPPEAPLPRPAPAAPAVESPAQTAAPAAAATATPPVPAAPPPVATASEPPPRPAAPPAPVVAAEPPKPRQVAAAPAVAPKPAAPAAVAGRGYRLQVGAVRSPEAAKQEWERLKRLHAEVLGGLSFSTERVDLGARGIYYRIQGGPVADAAKAERDCNELKRRGVGCILVKP